MRNYVGGKNKALAVDRINDVFLWKNVKNIHKGILVENDQLTLYSDAEW